MNIALIFFVLNRNVNNFQLSCAYSCAGTETKFLRNGESEDLMRYDELARFAIGGLWRQKVRTALTLIGVTVGTCALVFSLSLGFGLRAFIDNEFKSRDDFWRLIVHVEDPPPDTIEVPSDKAIVKGDMSETRRQRIREALVDRYLATRPRKPRIPLTPDKIAAIAALPDVAEVRTFRNSEARVMAAGAAKP